MDCKEELNFLMDSKEELHLMVEYKEELHLTTECKEETHNTLSCKEEEVMSFTCNDIQVLHETATESEENFTILGVAQPPSPVITVETSEKSAQRHSAENDFDEGNDDDEEWQPNNVTSSSEDNDLSAKEEWEPSGRIKVSVRKAKQKSVASTVRDVVVLQKDEEEEGSQDARFECPGCPFAFSTALFLKRHEKYCRHHQMDSSLVKEVIICESQSSDVDEPTTNSVQEGSARRTNSDDQAATDDIAICNVDSNDETEAIYKCEICTVWFFNEKLFKTHRKTHSGVEDSTLVYYCPKCERPFVRKYHLASHIRIKHNDETPHKCSQCDKTFGRKTDLCMHLRTHVDKNFLSCKYCDKKFLLEERYKEHLMIHELGQHVCPKCGQEFVRKSALRKHLERHSEDKSYTCSECNKGFSQKRHLTTHVRTHSGEQPFECTECGKRFSLRENYMRHLRSHTGDKPFACDKCGKRFAVKANLQNHVWTHSEKKPHVCEVCSRQFAEKNSLTRHMRTHSGEKPYLCSLCDKRFARKHHVKLHLQTHLKKGGDVVFSECEDEIDVT